MNLSFRELYSHALGTLQLKRVLATSSSGSVYLATTTTRNYAIKHVPAKPSHLQEIRLHQEISHLPCVVPLIEASMAISPDSGYLLTMPYFSHGSLFEWLTQTDNITFGTRKHVCMQAMQAVVMLHKYGVYHRDIKLENFLVHVHGGNVSVRLADFGMATKARWSRDRGCGSLMYMSPETITSLHSSSLELPILDAAKQDAWSMTQMTLNLMLSVNAWRAADASQDEFYQLYVSDPDTNLLLLLPLSGAFHKIVRAGFELDWMQRSTVKELYMLMDECWEFECPRQEFEERRRDALAVLTQHDDEEEEEEEVKTPVQAVMDDVWWEGLVMDSTCKQHSTSVMQTQLRVGSGLPELSL
jgi:serine/threonine protein kinase